MLEMGISKRQVKEDRGLTLRGPEMVQIERLQIEQQTIERLPIEQQTIERLQIEQ